MPLSLLTFSTNLTFGLSTTNTGFGNTVLQTSSIPFNLNNIDITTFNQCYATQITLASSASQTVDLTTLTNQVGESFGFGHALAIIVTPSGSQVTVEPGASNPLQWFFGGTTQSIVVNAGGMHAHSEPVTGPGAVVDSTHKTLKFTNSGGTTLVVTVGIVGSTT